MKYELLLGCALAASTPATAQQDVTPGGAAGTGITVTASGSAIPLDRAGQPVSVIGADEIASVQGPDVTRVLERLPGVSLARNGGLGTTTSLFVRGANSAQLLVLIDGIRVADVAAPGGGYDFGNLASGGLARIELLRGSNSLVWGSEAIGGVLALTTREVNGIEAGAEYGARESFDGQLGAGIVGESYGISGNFGYTRTDGFSQAATGTENDGFRQWRASGRAHVDLMPDLTASLAGRYTDGKVDIDGYPAPLYSFADTAEYQKTREVAGRAGLAWTSGALSLDAGYQVSDTRREYYDPSFPDPLYARTKGQSRRAELTGRWNATDAVKLDFGADHEWSDFDVGDDRRHAGLSSAHALLGWYGSAFSVAAGVRYDDHSRFGDEWTFGANGSVEVGGGWRLRASYGEGFKVPTLYQLFSEYGNPGLRAERSRSYDAGVEYGDRNGPLHAALTLFRRDSRDLIDYVSCFSSDDGLCDDGRYGFYENVARARAQGVELELGARISDSLRAQAVYTYLEATNRTRGDVNESNDLARRPRNAVTVALDWTSPWHGLALGADVRMVSDAYDNPGNFTRNDGYALATLRASVTVAEQVELFGRIENVTDAGYAVTAGYGTAGRSAYAGVRVKM